MFCSVPGKKHVVAVCRCKVLLNVSGCFEVEALKLDCSCWKECVPFVKVNVLAEA